MSPFNSHTLQIVQTLPLFERKLHISFGHWIAASQDAVMRALSGRGGRGGVTVMTDWQCGGTVCPLSTSDPVRGAESLGDCQVLFSLDCSSHSTRFQKGPFALYQSILGHGNQPPKVLLNFEDVSILSQSNRSLAQINQIYNWVNLHSYIEVLYLIGRLFIHLILS